MAEPPPAAPAPPPLNSSQALSQHFATDAFSSNVPKYANGSNSSSKSFKHSTPRESLAISEMISAAASRFEQLLLSSLASFKTSAIVFS